MKSNNNNYCLEMNKSHFKEKDKDKVKERQKPVEITNDKDWEEQLAKDQPTSSVGNFVTRDDLIPMLASFVTKDDLAQMTNQLMEVFLQSRVRTRSGSQASNASNGGDMTGSINVDVGAASPVNNGRITAQSHLTSKVIDLNDVRTTVPGDSISPARVWAKRTFKGKLDKATPAAIVKFKQDVDIFQKEHADVVRIGFYINKQIITALCFKLELSVDATQFLDLPNDTIYKLLFKYAIPESAAEWRKTFERSIQLARSKELYNATPTNFDKLYADTQVFITSFREIYHHMVPEDTEQIKRVVPPFTTSRVSNANNSSGQENTSMVQLFADMCPGGIGKDWNRIIFPYGFRDVKEIKDLDTYLDYILKKLLQFKSLSVELRPLSEFLGRNNSRLSKTSYQDPGKREQVNQLSGAQYSYDNGISDDSSDNDEYTSASEIEESAYEDDFELEDDDQLLHALNSTPRACFKMVDKGICDDMKTGKCLYSHDKDIIFKARVDRRRWLDTLDKRDKEDKATSNNPLKSTRAVCAINEGKRKDIKPRRSRKHFANGNKQKKHNEKQINSSDSEFLGHMVAMMSDGGNEGMIKELKTKVHINAEFNGFAVPIKFIALMDSGASRDNYLTSEFYFRFEKELEKFSKYCKGSVMLGDGKSQAQIFCLVTLPVVFCTNQAKRVVELTFVVYEALSTNQDAIIGLSSLLGDCYFTYLEVLSTARESMYSGIYNLDAQEYLEPFETVLEEAPEEVEFDTIPVNFAEYLNFMETGYEPSVQEFLDAIPTHCGAEMLRSTKLEDLLLSKGKRVFVPSNWDGISGVEVELDWKVDPPRKKPICRPVNERILATAKVEFERLTKYFYEPSNSDIVSPLVIAPKTTPPYIRFCGSYCAINKYLEIGHQPIPHVFHSLEKIAKFRLFADMDLMNSFHQFKLGKVTSARLSVQTPWGQVQPRFMPEGVGPATGILQKHMARIFQDFESWSIVLFDNILLLANDHDDMYRKLELFLDRCIEYNIVLKFNKSWIGVDKVTFFGYECQFQKFGISTKRIDAILNIAFPKDKKSMQSFLGTVVFMQPFTPNFAAIAAPLYDATGKSFDWNDEAQLSKLLEPFEALKRAVANCINLYYPDYDLQWFLRCDASDVGCGAVLFQKTDNGVIQPLAFISHKFSAVAQKWSVIERECFACYWAVVSNEYFLRCKSFILQTDHRNLQWMENSKTPKVVRWFVMLHSFMFLVQHIPGAHNKVADLLSRLHAMTNLSKLDMLKSAHGGRQGHFGVKRTLYSLKKLYPDSDITKEEVADFIKSCCICQKYNYPAEMSKPPILKSLRADTHRSVIAWDTLEVVLNAKGDRYLIVVVNLFTRFVHLYPVKTKTAKDVAMCILQYFASYGLMDIMHSDPGSEFCNDVVKVLLEWLGVGQSITLVNNPQADGVERVNKEVMKLLKMLVADERLKDNWSDFNVLPWVQIQLNSWVNSATGYSPFELQYGSVDVDYNSFPLDSPSEANAFVTMIGENLKLIRKISREIQQEVKLKYSRGTVDAARETFKSGEYVFLLLQAKVGVGNKLNSRKKGPYVVVKHDDGSNVVTVKDLVTDKLLKLNQKDLQIFVGDIDSAVRVSRLDTDQHEIDCIIGYAGNPEKRKSLDFLVKFTDGEEVWLPYSNDTNQTEAFQKFCKLHKELGIVLMSLEDVKILKREVMAKNVDMDMSGKFIYLNYRVWDCNWCDWLDCLKDRYKTNYVVLAKVVKVSMKSKDYKIYVPLFRKTFLVNNWFIYLHGSMLELGDAVLVDEGYVKTIV